MWLALVLALGGVQSGCGGEDPYADSDGDGVRDGEDCDSTSSARWKRVQAYSDADRDGFGDTSPSSVCIGNALPESFSHETGDCAPRDATRWRLEDGLYEDTDRDGVASGPARLACVGSDLTGYSRTKDADDCDDSDPAVWALRELYPDEDRDGVAGGTRGPRCVGTTLPPGTSETALDCAPQEASRYQLLSYRFRDADGDGISVPEASSVCAGKALPMGYLLESLAPTDCDDTRADRWRLLDVYPDTDADGVGSGSVEQRCSSDGPEPGYVQTQGDCAPTDSSRWVPRAYAYRDADGDGATVAESGQVCSGASLPRGYLPWGASPDCDDTNASARVSWSVFADTDGDGVGAGPTVTLCAGTTRPAGYSDKGTDCDDSRAAVHHALQAYVDEDSDGVGAGSASSFCTDGSVPAGYSSQGTDCAPGDALTWQLLAYQHVDADRDGSTTPASGSVCTGAPLPPPYAASASGNDCDDADPGLHLWRVLYPDRDGDGVGAPPRAVLCLASEAPPPGSSVYGFDPNDSNPDVKELVEDPELDAILLGG
ncbi:hypothetical protein [Archangium sp.]|uniref:hypothetical protein n=1 Tax=Archangium sp. TaxID=1872627 RepID=UPI002EDA77D7